MPRKARRAGELRPQAVLSRPLHSCPSLPPNFKCNSCPNLPLPARDPETRAAAAGSPLFLELRLLSALCLAPGVAVCDTAVALPLHRHPQLSAEQLGQWGQGARYVTGLGGSASEHHSWGLGTSSGGALSSAGLCAPEKGLSRGVARRVRQGKGRVGGSSSVRHSWKVLTAQPLSALCSQHVHKCLCHHSVLWSAVCPLEWAAHGSAETQVPGGSKKDR